MIVLTARDARGDRVAGLDAGADDYLVKPFELDELNARIRAVVRRHAGRAEPLLSASGVTLDPASRRVSKNGVAVALSAREFAVLEALMTKPGAVLSRTQLEDRLYGWGEEIESNAISVYVHQLRKKLGAEFIRNARGVGYFDRAVTSIRLRLLVSLLALLALTAAAMGAVTYRNVLAETEALFDYQLQQMAWSLRDQGEIAAAQADTLADAQLDFVIQIWTVDGRSIYQSRPHAALPARALLGLATLNVEGHAWRTYSVATGEHVIQVAQPVDIRERLAARAAWRSVLPLLLMAPLAGLGIWWLAARNLAPLDRLAGEVRSRDEQSLAPLAVGGLPDEVAPLARRAQRAARAIAALARCAARLRRRRRARAALAADGAQAAARAAAPRRRRQRARGGARCHRCRHRAGDPAGRAAAGAGAQRARRGARGQRAGRSGRRGAPGAGRNGSVRELARRRARADRSRRPSSSAATRCRSVCWCATSPTTRRAIRLRARASRSASAPRPRARCCASTMPGRASRRRSASASSTASIDAPRAAKPAAAWAWRSSGASPTSTARRSRLDRSPAGGLRVDVRFARRALTSA